MNKQLERVLVESNLHEIIVTIVAGTTTTGIKVFNFNLQEYIDTFGYVAELGEQEVDILNVEKITDEDIAQGITYTHAEIIGYGYNSKISFYNLINACKALSECRGTNERMLVLDYLTCVVSLCTNVSVKEVKSKLMFQSRECLIEFLKENELDVNKDSKAYKYIDFERWADEFIKYDYIESTNGFIFRY